MPVLFSAKIKKTIIFLVEYSLCSFQMSYVTSPSGLVFPATIYAQYMEGTPKCATPNADYGPITTTIAICGIFSIFALIALFYMRCAPVPSVQKATEDYIAAAFELKAQEQEQTEGHFSEEEAEESDEESESASETGVDENAPYT